MKYKSLFRRFRNIRIEYLFLSVFIVSLIAGLLLTDRKLLISPFIVEGATFAEPDLLVVLEGGGLNFSPTRERVDKLLELYRQYHVNVLVCAYRVHKREIVEYLEARGIKAEDIITTGYWYEGKTGSGTYNNVLEILSAIKKYNYKHIEIVTSPYHELRVSIIFSAMIKRSIMDRKIYIRYGHISDSEILETDTPRLSRMLAHELLGIAGFYMHYMYSEMRESL